MKTQLANLGLQCNGIWNEGVEIGAEDVDEGCCSEVYQTSLVIAMRTEVTVNRGSLFKLLGPCLSQARR